MIEFMNKKDILGLKQQGVSNRAAAKQLGIDRKTVAKYWNEYQLHMSQLTAEGADTRAVQDRLYKTPEYQSTEKKRKSRKYTEETDKRLREILAEERRKDAILGKGHKQKLTNKQIHQKLVDEGFGIGRGAVNKKISAYP